MRAVDSGRLESWCVSLEYFISFYPLLSICPTSALHFLETLMASSPRNKTFDD